MNFSTIEKIADAVLYEGYILYPYRPSSIKNQQRWNFGTLYPRDFALAQQPEESWCFRAEVIVEGSESTQVDARIRFLHLVPAGDAEHGWDQGFARLRTIEGLTLEQICAGFETHFDFDQLSDAESQTAPAQFSSRNPPQDSPCVGKLTLGAECVAEGVYRLRVVFANETPMPDAVSRTRKLAQAVSFTSAHLLLHVSGGALVSALDPAPGLAAAVGACRNQGVFPVLAGEAGERSHMLVSPIILYDYPQIAPESTGDFFDGTEMDEMLALRVMTLTDAEQEEMRRSDPHARAILERMETLPKEHLLKVHGAVRGMRPIDDATAAQGPQSSQNSGTPESFENAIQPWSPFDERPPITMVRIFGAEVRAGYRVRIWPQKKADIMDMAIEGKTAVVESIVQDLEDRIQLAVVLDDDPGRDLGLLQKAGHRFFFTPEEIEPLGLEAL